MMRIVRNPSRTVAAIAGLCIGALLVSGCDSSTESLQTLRAAVRPASAGPGDDENVASLTATPATRDFRPVNPDRKNPFEYPYVGSDNPSPDTLFSDGAATASQVTVLGFADVGVPRVILRIGDQTKVLRAGDQVLNITVKKIDPPRVELQIDNLSWTATMFDERQ